MSSKPTWNDKKEDEMKENFNYTFEEPKIASEDHTIRTDRKEEINRDTIFDNAMNDLQPRVNNQQSLNTLKSEAAEKTSAAHGSKNHDLFGHDNVTKISSLDFERIINEYSIQATKKRIFGDKHTLPLENWEEVDQFKQIPNTFENSEQIYKQYGATSSLSKYSGETLSYDNNSDKNRRRIFFKEIDSTIPLISSPSLQHDHVSTKMIQKLHKKRKKKKTVFFGYSGKTMTRWILTCIIGLLTGLTAIMIMKVSEKLVFFRLHRLNRLQADLQNNLTNYDDIYIGLDDKKNGHFGDDDDRKEIQPIQLLSPLLFLSWNYILIFLEYLIFNLVLAMSSALLCLWAPDAVGSGIPEVRFINHKTSLYFIEILE